MTDTNPEDLTRNAAQKAVEAGGAATETMEGPDANGDALDQMSIEELLQLASFEEGLPDKVAEDAINRQVDTNRNDVIDDIATAANGARTHSPEVIGKVQEANNDLNNKVKLAEDARAAALSGVLPPGVVKRTVELVAPVDKDNPTDTEQAPEAALQEPSTPDAGSDLSVIAEADQQLSPGEGPQVLTGMHQGDLENIAKINRAKFEKKETDYVDPASEPVRYSQDDLRNLAQAAADRKEKNTKPGALVKESPKYTQEDLNQLGRVVRPEADTARNLTTKGQEAAPAPEAKIAPEKLESKYGSGLEGMRRVLPRKFDSIIDRMEARKLSKKFDTEYAKLAKSDATLKRLTTEYRQLIGADQNPDLEELVGKPANEVRQVLNELLEAKLLEIGSSKLSEKDKLKERQRLEGENMRLFPRLEKLQVERDEMAVRYEQGRRAMESYKTLRDQAVERTTDRIDEKLNPREQKYSELKADEKTLMGEIEAIKDKFTSYTTQAEEYKKTNPNGLKAQKAFEKRMEACKVEFSKKLKLLDKVTAELVPLGVKVNRWKGEKEGFNSLTREKENEGVYAEREEDEGVPDGVETGSAEGGEPQAEADEAAPPKPGPAQKNKEGTETSRDFSRTRNVSEAAPNPSHERAMSELARRKEGAFKRMGKGIWRFLTKKRKFLK